MKLLAQTVETLQTKLRGIRRDMTVNKFLYIGDDPELIDALVLKLSKRINSKSELRDLATLGLGVPDPTIGKNLTNKDDITMAAYNVIMDWRKGQDNYKIAYVNLCEALRDEDVGMASYIKSVLEPTWNKMKEKL